MMMIMMMIRLKFKQKSIPILDRFWGGHILGIDFEFVWLLIPVVVEQFAPGAKVCRLIIKHFQNIPENK